MFVEMLMEDRRKRIEWATGVLRDTLVARRKGHGVAVLGGAVDSKTREALTLYGGRLVDAEYVLTPGGRAQLSVTVELEDGSLVVCGDLTGLSDLMWEDKSCSESLPLRKKPEPSATRRTSADG